MVVDDSAVIRGLISRILETAGGIKVIASVSNGEAAVAALDRYKPEVVVLDIEMPVMDGMTALPLLLRKDRTIQVLMASTLTLRNADISMEAMRKGAADYIPKPTSTTEISGGADFRRDIVDKVRMLGLVARRRRGMAPTTARSSAFAPRTATSSAPASGERRTTPSLHQSNAKIALRPRKHSPVAAIGIGSSTGGPQALFKVFGMLKAAPPKQPIFITQHMPATFTTILAEHISRVYGRPVREVEDGDVVEPGGVYVARGDHHMVLEKRGAQVVIHTPQTPPENFCRPAVDPMFRSLADVYGGGVLGVVLTGMGSDGAKGGVVLADRGGNVIAQDEATSVVWGMPGATAQAGACMAILPVEQIAPEMKKVIAGL